MNLNINVSNELELANIYIYRQFHAITLVEIHSCLRFE